MKVKTTFFVLSALFILLGNSLALAVSDVSGETPSGDATASGELPPATSGEVSGEVSGEPSGELPPVTSGEPSGELPPATSGDNSGDASGDIIPFYYEDMQKHWANYAASQLAARGIVIGEEIGDKFYYHPDMKITRGDFLLFVLATLDNMSGETANVSFADKETIPEFLLDEAKVAYKLKLIKGVGANDKIYLYPQREITRAEAFVIINNALSSKTTVANSTAAIKYADSAKIPSWSLQSIKNLTGYKIIQGSSNAINANSVMSRAEAAELCYKLLKQIEISSLTTSGDSGDLK